MGKIMDWLLGRTPVESVSEPPVLEDQEIKLPPAVSKTSIVKIPRIKNPALAFKRRPGANEFEQPEYDLAEVGRIEDSVHGSRFTAARFDGNLRVLSFADLWTSIEAIQHGKYTEDRQYIYPPEGIEVLSGELQDGKIVGVWKPIRYITRHKVSKKGFVFMQKHGNTEVTADHGLISLVNGELVEFKPEEARPIAKLSSISKTFFGQCTSVDLGVFLPLLTRNPLPRYTRDNGIITYHSNLPLKNDGFTNKDASIDQFVPALNLHHLAALIGAYISEGSVKAKSTSEYCAFRISSSDHNWLVDLEERFNILFPSLSSSTKIINTGDGMFALSCDRQIIADLFANMCGYQSANKKIPDFVFQLPRELVDVFKSYMIDGDGNRQTYGYSYCTKSLALASGWSFLLRLEGINHTFNYRFNNSKCYYSIRTNLYFEKKSCKTWLEPVEYIDEWVYDLEVEDTHNFLDLAGQVLLHNTEAYVRRAFRYKEGLMFKEGWELVGANTKTIRYIKERFAQMDQATGIPHPLIIRGVGSDLVRFSNAYLVKVRKTEASGGKLRKIPGKKKELQPVAGYFFLPPTTIQIKRDKFGKIQKYRQMMPDQSLYRDFKPEDVIHFFFDRKKGFLVGTPTLVPVKDDIRALRRIEENIEMLVYQCLFPLFHYKVGTENAPAQTYPDGSREVDIVKMEIEYMPAEGAIVTPERHEIKAIGSEGRALRAEGYLNHFKSRVLAGLGVSAVDMGEGDTANRACYSEDTETLTDSGFKRYSEITKDDLIATYNPETGQMEFHEPNGAMLAYYYQGEMYHFSNRNIDTLVTPDHDMWVGRPLWKGLQWGKLHADSINVENFRFLTGGLNWEGIEPEDFNLPHVSYLCYSEVPNAGPFPRIPIKDWLEFLGYYVSEGCLAKTKGKWALTISQNSLVNANKTRKIRACLERLPFKFNEYTNPSDNTTRFWINCKSLYLYLEENCGDYSYLKHFPAKVLNYTPSLLRILFEAAMLGDGTTDIRQGRTSRTYYSTSDILIDQMQEIALKLGYRAHVLLGDKCKRVCISEHTEAHITNKQVSIVNYDGIVYCFNVPNHLFITRRNGRIGIHGNTADNMSRNMVDDVKSMQRELEVLINEYIIKELLLESTFEDPLLEENLVKVKFHEIDLDAKIKVENHAINAFAGHALIHPELRNIFGKEPLTEEEEQETFWTRIKEPELLIQSLDEPYSSEAKALARANTTSISEPDLEEEGKARKAELAQQAASRAAGQSGRNTPAKRSSTGGQRAAKAATTPSNQHGTKRSPEKRKSAFRLADMVAEGNVMTQVYNELRDDAVAAVIRGHYSEGWLRSTAAAAATQMREHIARLARMNFREGFRKSGATLDFQEEKFSFDVLEQRIEGIVNRYINRLVKKTEDILKTVESREDAVNQIVNIFDALQFRSRFIYNSEANKAMNYGIARGLRKQGHELVLVIKQENACDECKSHTEAILLKNVTISDLPGWHPNCTCRLSVQ